MKIYTRKSRVYRNLILGLVWLALLVSKWYSNPELGGSHLVYALAALIFIGLAVVEMRKPYITIENGLLSQGLFAQNSIKLSEIEEWQSKAGILILAGKNHRIKILPSRISQKDMERIYEVLKNDW